MKITSSDKYITAVPHIPEIQKSRPTDYQERPIPIVVVRNASIPSDVLHFTRENDLIGGTLTPKDGTVEGPDTPGLGIELDMSAVEQYRVA